MVKQKNKRAGTPVLKMKTKPCFPLFFLPMEELDANPMCVLSSLSYDDAMGLIKVWNEQFPSTEWIIFPCVKHSLGIIHSRHVDTEDSRLLAASGKTEEEKVSAIMRFISRGTPLLRPEEKQEQVEVVNEDLF